MEIKLTDEQKKQLKVLRRKFALNAAFAGIKFAASIFLSNILVLAINAFFVHNNTFAFIGCLVSDFMVCRSLRLYLMKEFEKIKAEIEKILKE